MNNCLHLLICSTLLRGHLVRLLLLRHLIHVRPKFVLQCLAYFFSTMPVCLLLQVPTLFNQALLNVLELPLHIPLKLLRQALSSLPCPLLCSLSILLLGFREHSKPPLQLCELLGCRSKRGGSNRERVQSTVQLSAAPLCISAHLGQGLSADIAIGPTSSRCKVCDLLLHGDKPIVETPNLSVKAYERLNLKFHLVLDVSLPLV
mmetsp:Transcript_57779/g.111438  ORF Transcript_57779/g.111438 Transcript_57779/m.111438 type:complete len:204 (-) Transcript_57779:318-929(-)